MIFDSIQFGSKKIDFLIEYSNRKTLGITVTPEMDVIVKAPTDSTLEKIKEKLNNLLCRKQNLDSRGQKSKLAEDSNDVQLVRKLFSCAFKVVVLFILSNALEIAATFRKTAL